MVPFVDDVTAARTSAMGWLLRRRVKYDRDWAESFFRRTQHRVRVEAVDGGDEKSAEG